MKSSQMDTPELDREDRLTAIEVATGYIFNNNELCITALRTAGLAAAGGNKRLAQVGDSALRLSLVVDGYENGATREQIDNALRNKASNTYLASRGIEKSLDKCVYRIKGVDISPKIMATTVQAILGAVFLDCKKDTSVFQDVTRVLGLSWPEDGTNRDQRAQNTNAKVVDKKID